MMNKRYNGRLLFEAKDAYGTVEVVEYNDMRCLHFGTPTKQCGYNPENPSDIQLEYAPLMMMNLIFCPNPKRILYLGLGGGTMVSYLWNYFPECQFDAVERSPAVLEAAYKCFDLPKDERINIYIVDALEFIEKISKDESCYDLIFIDLYIANAMSDVLKKKSFFKSCLQSLNSNGVLSWNLWGSTPGPFLEECVKSLCASFGQNIMILPSKKHMNLVILTFKDTIPCLNRAEITQIAADLEERMSFSFTTLVKELQYFKGYHFPGMTNFC